MSLEPVEIGENGEASRGLPRELLSRVEAQAAASEPKAAALFQELAAQSGELPRFVSNAHAKAWSSFDPNDVVRRIEKCEELNGKKLSDGTKQVIALHAVSMWSSLDPRTPLSVAAREARIKHITAETQKVVLGRMRADASYESARKVPEPKVVDRSAFYSLTGVSVPYDGYKNQRWPLTQPCRCRQGSHKFRGVGIARSVEVAPCSNHAASDSVSSLKPLLYTERPAQTPTYFAPPPTTPLEAVNI